LTAKKFMTVSKRKSRQPRNSWLFQKDILTAMKLLALSISKSQQSILTVSRITSRQVLTTPMPKSLNFQHGLDQSLNLNSFKKDISTSLDKTNVLKSGFSSCSLLRVPTLAVSTRISRHLRNSGQFQKGQVVNWEILDSFKKDILIVKKLLVSTVKNSNAYNDSLIQFTTFVSLTSQNNYATKYFHNFLSFTAYLVQKMQYTKTSKKVLLFSKIFFNFIKMN
jgi:hypothetical protein